MVDGDRGWRRSASSGAGSPAIGEGGENVGRMRRSLGKSGAALVELGDGEDDRDDGDSALVSCNSGEGERARGRSCDGRRRSKPCQNDAQHRGKLIGGRGSRVVAHRRWRRR